MELKFLKMDPTDGTPYSDVVECGEMLYLSGLVSEDFESGELVCGDIAVQTRQVLKNLASILDRYGSDMEHVVRVEVLLTDYALSGEMNAEYVKHFDASHLPSRMCYGGVELYEGCLIEIMATAVKK
jgi:2-iminobutanoate/2-iminopropanoate deaminase